MYKIKLQKHSNGGRNVFDEVIEIDREELPSFTYAQYMNKPYYFGILVKIVNEKEVGIASFCNSNYAKPKWNTKQLMYFLSIKCGRKDEKNGYSINVRNG